MVQEQVDQQQPLFQNGQTNADIFFFFLKKWQQNKSSVHSENTHCCSLTALKPGGNHALFLTHPKPSYSHCCWLSVPQQQLHSCVAQHLYYGQHIPLSTQCWYPLHPSQKTLITPQAESLLTIQN